MKNYYFDDNEMSAGFIKNFSESDDRIIVTYGNKEKIVAPNNEATKKAIIDIMQSQVKEVGSKIKAISSLKSRNLSKVILYTIGTVLSCTAAILLSILSAKIAFASLGLLFFGCTTCYGIKYTKFKDLENDYYKNRFFLENQEIINSLPMFNDEAKHEEITINDLDRYKYNNLKVMRDDAKRHGKIRTRINTNKREM